MDGKMEVNSDLMHDLKNDWVPLKLVDAIGSAMFQMRKSIRADMTRENMEESLKLLNQIDDIGTPVYELRKHIWARIEKDYFDAIRKGEE